MIKIEKGVPLSQRCHPISGRKYPFPDMEIGDSFLVKDGSPRAIACSARYMGKRLGRTFRSSKTPNGVRVWRVA